MTNTKIEEHLGKTGILLTLKRIKKLNSLIFWCNLKKKKIKQFIHFGFDSKFDLICQEEKNVHLFMTGQSSMSAL